MPVPPPLRASWWATVPAKAAHRRRPGGGRAMAPPWGVEDLRGRTQATRRRSPAPGRRKASFSSRTSRVGEVRLALALARRGSRPRPARAEVVDGPVAETRWPRSRARGSPTGRLRALFVHERRTRRAVVRAAGVASSDGRCRQVQVYGRTAFNSPSPPGRPSGGYATRRWRSRPGRPCAAAPGRASSPSEQAVGLGAGDAMVGGEGRTRRAGDLIACRRMSSADSPRGSSTAGPSSRLTILRQPRVVEYSSVCPAGKEPVRPRPGRGARVIDSTPPARAIERRRRRWREAAWTTASRPEAHSLFTVTPGTVGGQAGPEEATMRATFAFSSPAPLALPVRLDPGRIQAGRAERVPGSRGRPGRRGVRPPGEPLYLRNRVRTA